MDDTPETTPPTQVQKLAAEAIGTAALVFVGCAALTLGGGSAALPFGLALAALIFVFGRVSGAHFNPAVSLGYAAGGKMTWAEAGTYCAAQLVGGVVAAIVLFLTLIGEKGYQKFDGQMGQNYFGDQSQLGASYAVWAALLLELVLTIVFVMVVLGARDRRQTSPIVEPLVIGFAYAALIYASYAATGGSMNPARSFGPALFSGGDSLVQVWPFLLAPAVGGVVAGLVYPMLFGRDAEAVPGSGLNFSKTSQPQGYTQPWAPQTGGYPTPQTGGYPQAATPTPTPEPAPQVAQPVVQQQPAEQPIIQDGWQWDPQAQQWIPAQQQPPVGGWPVPQASEQTQIRNPEGP